MLGAECPECWGLTCRCGLLYTSWSTAALEDLRAVLDAELAKPWRRHAARDATILRSYESGNLYAGPRAERLLEPTP